MVTKGLDFPNVTLVGVIAAVVPAWRATKLDILRAIATE